MPYNNDDYEKNKNKIFAGNGNISEKKDLIKYLINNKINEIEILDYLLQTNR